MQKNGFLTFVCACVPGCGQMYYGYMRRGTSLALCFWGIVFLASLSGLGIIGIVLPVIWAYAFFDTFNIRALTYEQRLAFADEFIPNGQWFQERREKGFFQKGSVGRFMGWVLIIVGILALYNTVLSRHLWHLFENFPYVTRILHSVPTLVVAVLVIVIGARILKGSRFAKNDSASDTQAEHIQ